MPGETSHADKEHEKEQHCRIAERYPEIPRLINGRGLPDQSDQIMAISAKKSIYVGCPFYNFEPGRGGTKTIFVDRFFPGATSIFTKDYRVRNFWMRLFPKSAT